MQNITEAGALHGFNRPGNDTDHIALLAIKSQLMDHPEGVLSSWNNSVHHCNWEGVACGHKHKRVTVLDLNSRSLSGTISPFIGNLTFLNTISLYNNSLYGQIPHELGDLIRLQKLQLMNNTLVGEIPVNLSSCINLRILSIASNNLEGKLPTQLRALSKLEMLNVGFNNITGPLFDIIQNLTSLRTIATAYNSFTGSIPNSISRMQNLINLGLAGNKFSGTLPISLFNFSSLQVLDFTDNQLSGKIPAHMGFNIPSLIWLSFAGNNFSGPIPPITNFTSLEKIMFQFNSFTGRVPQDFQQFQNLSELSFSYNYLEGDINFISTLINCTQLSILQLMMNDFSGILPKSVGNLSTTLTYLTIGDSSISGIFPTGITNLINLQLLYIGDTDLTESIPHDLEKLHKLEILHLGYNRLTGKIPSSWGNLSHLSKLYLNDNKLTHSVPRSIGNCQGLIYMDLSNNELNGTLDKELFTGSATFVSLDLSYNHLEGPLPLEISKQTILNDLTMSTNKFSGVLPDGLGECSELQYLYMDRNSFRGVIPSSYASLASLQEIDFSQNDLSGPIPAFFSNITTISYLNLSYNDFQGRVPTKSIFANRSGIFLLGNIRLCGGITELHLPKCIETESMERKKKAMSRTLKFIIPVISALVGLSMLTGIYLACIRQKKTNLSPDLAMGKAFMKVSYDMLLKATVGFSSENLLGTGSFGSVFMGILEGKTVAVKVINLQGLDVSKSFMAECKALRNIRHRNLVGIVTACSSIDFQRNDFRALVYEFMPNRSLDKWLYGVVGNMSLTQRVGIAIDVAHALIYLHHDCETPIVHCDLKPSNILLDNDMVAHVGDFGLARILTQPRHPNQSSTIGIKGTIGYAAPGNNIVTPFITLCKPDQVLQLVDPALVEDNLSDEADDRTAIQDTLERRVECIVTVISVGVSCSNHLPQNRMKITDAISSLRAARDNLLTVRNRRNCPDSRAKFQHS